MADKNYTFDPNSLTYRKDEKTRGRRILIRILTQFFAAIFIGVLVFFAISYTITTPSLKRIREENSFMQQEYKRVEDKYNQANELLKKSKSATTNYTAPYTKRKFQKRQQTVHKGLKNSKQVFRKEIP